VTFDGITGATFSARVAHDNWSSLNSLSSSGIQAFDSWDTGVGVEATGPHIMQRIITLRGGAQPQASLVVLEPRSSAPPPVPESVHEWTVNRQHSRLTQRRRRATRRASAMSGW
jgi:hypothetical protein